MATGRERPVRRSDLATREGLERNWRDVNLQRALIPPIVPRVSVRSTSKSQPIEMPQPVRHPVPTADVLVHQPSLASIHERATVGKPSELTSTNYCGGCPPKRRCLSSNRVGVRDTCLSKSARIGQRRRFGILQPSTTRTATFKHSQRDLRLHSDLACSSPSPACTSCVALNDRTRYYTGVTSNLDCASRHIGARLRSVAYSAFEQPSAGARNDVRDVHGTLGEASTRCSMPASGLRQTGPGVS
jgi:hypothetical protein